MYIGTSYALGSYNLRCTTIQSMHLNILGARETFRCDEKRQKSKGNENGGERKTKFCTAKLILALALYTTLYTREKELSRSHPISDYIVRVLAGQAFSTLLIIVQSNGVHRDWPDVRCRIKRNDVIE